MLFLLGLPKGVAFPATPANFKQLRTRVASERGGLGSCVKFDWKVASKEVFDMPYIKGKGPSVVVALGGNALGTHPPSSLNW